MGIYSNNMENNKEFGIYLKEKRKAAGLAQWALFRKSDVAHSYIAKLERGEIESPSPEVLKRLSEHLSCSYIDLMVKAGYLDEQDTAILMLEKDGLIVAENTQSVISLLRQKEIINLLTKLAHLDEKERLKIIRMLEIAIEK